MICNQNEKYLLNFISGANESPIKNELIELVYKLGIKVEFKDFNPVYKIIDELTYAHINEKF